MMVTKVDYGQEWSRLWYFKNLKAFGTNFGAFANLIYATLSFKIMQWKYFEPSIYNKKVLQDYLRLNFDFDLELQSLGVFGRIQFAWSFVCLLDLIMMTWSSSCFYLLLSRSLSSVCHLSKPTMAVLYRTETLNKNISR